MSLLSEYTLSLLENDKIAVDFADTIPSDYERVELLKFFKKYKRDVYVDFAENHIFSMVLPWQHWVEFLISLGFKDTAKACCEVLYDLEVKNAQTMEEYVSQLKQARIIKDVETKPAIDKNIEQYEELKQVEIDRLIREKGLLVFNPKSSSELAFEKELPRLLQEHEGAFVAYINGKIVGFDDEENVLIETVTYEKNMKPDLVKKIEEVKEKEEEK
jgi:hypothetical protein